METLFGSVADEGPPGVPDGGPFAREKELMRELARACCGLDLAGTDREEAVGLLAALKRVELAVSGAKLATIGYVEQLEEAAARELREAKAAGREPDVPGGAGKKTTGEERSVHDTLTKEGKQGRAKTTREMKQARSLAVFPLFAKMIREGRLSWDYLDVLEREIPKAQIGQVQDAEEWFVNQAMGEPVDEFRKTIKVWQVTHHPERAVESARRQARQEKFSVFPDGDGFRLAGWLGAMNGTILVDALRGAVGVPHRDDDRPRELRNAHGLMDLVETGANGGAGNRAAGGGPRQQIMVTVPLETLVQTERAVRAGCGELERAEGDREAGDIGVAGPTAYAGTAEEEASSAQNTCPTTGAGLGRRGECLDSQAELSEELGRALAVIRAGFDPAMMEGHSPGVLPDGRPVAPSRLAGMLCDSDVARVVLSSHSEPIDLSRKQRLFSPRQVRAVRVRDRRCRYPGCERGPELCQVHHAQEHERGGPTTMDNAVLLCFHHHDYIHDEQITITHHAGGFVFSAKSGAVIGVSRNETYARVQESGESKCGGGDGILAEVA